MQGGDPNFILPVEGVAPIHLAAGLGYEATRLLLQYGGDPNIRFVLGFFFMIQIDSTNLLLT